ncbi:MAG: bifunctional DNA primase/polymerase [Pseudomonadota bacterium]|nr:bifunctional DNA primase/polymerase [Pseudomonadota bacterium]MEE3281099.1 bifunctional DNA primase/polymerase [Pseudomonadota bacterium]MEE3292968.1 bifunctional DNA primase/polymerase [Pseudomonadota bacterium]
MNKAISAHAEATEGALKQAAISLAEAGFRVFRLRPKEKVPLAKGWQDQATDDPEAVARLWDARPQANIGVATGGGIVVVDVDRKDGKDGDESIRLVAESTDLAGYRVTTPSGGYHLYFHSEQPVRNRTSLLLGVDIRADGGYVVGPGSEIDGKFYELVDGRIAPAPGWLSDLLAMDHRTLEAEEPDGPIPKGRRNDALFKVACSLHGKGLPERQIYGALTQENERCDPPLPNDELKTIAGSAATYPDSGGIDISGLIPNLTTHSDKENLLGFCLSDWMASRFLGPPPEIDWLIEGVIPHGVPGLFAGIGGIGKSYMLLDLAFKVASASSEPILGGKIAKHGKVVVLTAEDGQNAIHRRLGNIADETGRIAVAEHLCVVPLPDAGGTPPLLEEGVEGLTMTAQWAGLLEQINELGEVVLVVIDPLQAFLRAKIDQDNAAGQLWWSEVSAACAKLDTAFLVAHHMRKSAINSTASAMDAREAIRGATALVDGARFVYALWVASESEVETAEDLLGCSFGPTDLAHGAIVKANDTHDRLVRDFIRDPVSGILIDRSGELSELNARTKTIPQDVIEEIFAEIKHRFDNAAKSPMETFSASTNAGGRYLATYMLDTHGIKKSVAKFYIDSWVKNGCLKSEVVHKGRKIRGLRVIQLPRSRKIGI